ncbi:zinc-dependent alcohol dehydrogenase family protein [soil metagenome]
MHRTWVTIWFMRATVLHSPRDIRLDDVAAPQLFDDTDAIVRVVASCICGSDLWPYRGINAVPEPKHIGHEFIGIVESVGSAVAKVAPGQFVIAPFNASDNTCSVCERGMQASCKNFTAWGANDSNGNFVQGGQGEFVRVPFADGTLVATPSEPDAALIPHLLTLSDVFPTGHHAAVAAGVTPGSTVAVVGDGAVGLSAVLAAKRLGATTIVAMSRHATRQDVARAFGATHVVSARGKEGAKEVREILDGMGADYVLECVGTNDSMQQATMCARPGGQIGYVGVPHDITLDIPALWRRNIGFSGGIAPVRAYLPELLADVWAGAYQPGLVFDQTLSLSDVATGYRAMDERTAIKTLLTV